jgi:membrane protease YdiL (CAAX protease family)
MYRNSPVAPFFFLLAAVAMFLSVFLSGQKTALQTGHPPGPLSSLQIAFMAFAMTFLVYAAIGFVSIWLEGEEQRPLRHVPNRGRTALAAGLGLLVLLVACEGLFFRVILYGINQHRLPPLLEASVAGGMAVCAILVLLLYQRFFMTREVVADDEEKEIPW